jgi:acetyl esterase
MELHPEARAFLTEVVGQPRLSELTPQEVRAREARARSASGEHVATVEDGWLGAVRIRRYEPEQAVGIVVWLHGGGWVAGGLNTHDAMCRRLANAAGCTVFGVDYRLAPEHPFPAGLDDSFAALCELARRYPSAPLVVGGDSAGGNIAAVCAIRARELGGPRLALQVLVSPVLDCAMTTGSYGEHGGTETLVGSAEMEWCWRHYLDDPAAGGRWEASPLRAPDLHGLPAAVIVVAGHDPLRDEDLAYAEHLREAGVAVEVHRYDDMFHAFFPSVDLFERAREAVDGVAASLRRAVGDRRDRRIGPANSTSARSL